MLSIDLYRTICLYLSIDDLSNFCLLSKKFYTKIWQCDDGFWKHRLSEEFRRTICSSYRDLYYILKYNRSDLYYKNEFIKSDIVNAGWCPEPYSFWYIDLHGVLFIQSKIDTIFPPRIIRNCIHIENQIYQYPFPEPISSIIYDTLFIILTRTGKLIIDGEVILTCIRKIQGSNGNYIAIGHKGELYFFTNTHFKTPFFIDTHITFVCIESCTKLFYIKNHALYSAKIIHYLSFDTIQSKPCLSFSVNTLRIIDNGIKEYLSSNNAYIVDTDGCLWMHNSPFAIDMYCYKADVEFTRVHPSNKAYWIHNNDIWILNKRDELYLQSLGRLTYISGNVKKLIHGENDRYLLLLHPNNPI